MRTDPLNDAWLFLQGLQPDQVALGNWQMAFVLLFAGLLLASLVVAVVAWRGNPAQRRLGVAWMWLFRLSIGCMWFQAALWKLPFPVSGGFQYWTEQMAENAAYPFYADLVKTALLPHMDILDPLVFAAELGMAVSLILGVLVRPVGWLGALYAGVLWIGLYRGGAEGPWEFMVLMIVMGQFAVSNAGWCLGIDGLFARRARRW